MINPAAAIRDWLSGPHEHEDMADAVRDVLRTVLAITQPDLTAEVEQGNLLQSEADMLNDGWSSAQHGILNGICDALGIGDDTPTEPSDAELVEAES